MPPTPIGRPTVLILSHLSSPPYPPLPPHPFSPIALDSVRAQDHTIRRATFRPSPTILGLTTLPLYILPQGRICPGVDSAPGQKLPRGRFCPGAKTAPGQILPRGKNRPGAE